VESSDQPSAVDAQRSAAHANDSSSRT
jgi:hypothetical protein